MTPTGDRTVLVFPPAVLAVGVYTIVGLRGCIFSLFFENCGMLLRRGPSFWTGVFLSSGVAIVEVVTGGLWVDGFGDGWWQCTCP